MKETKRTKAGATVPEPPTFEGGLVLVAVKAAQALSAALKRRESAVETESVDNVLFVNTYLAIGELTNGITWALTNATCWGLNGYIADHKTHNQICKALEAIEEEMKGRYEDLSVNQTGIKIIASGRSLILNQD